MQYLTSDEGKADLKELGGLSARHGRRDPARADRLRRTRAPTRSSASRSSSPRTSCRPPPDGRGLVSLVELPNLQDRPAVFSTFLMWLLADLFHDLPEVGDVDKPKLVFFFDEAHLLFNDASKAFLDQIAQTVRLIRSKGVGVFFVTQSPTDVPDEVLAQLGSRIQHQLRAHTPNDAKALKATVNTYPNSAYDDLGEVITGLGIGEAIVTVMNERGAPTPVAWTRLRAPESLMGPPTRRRWRPSVDGQPALREVRRRPSTATPPARCSPPRSRRARARQAEEEAAEERARRPQVRGRADLVARRRTSRRVTKDDGGIVARRRELRRLQGLHAHRGPRDRARDVRDRPPLSRPAQADQRTASSTRSASACTPRRSRRAPMRLLSAWACRVCRRSRCSRSRSARRAARSAPWWSRSSSSCASSCASSCSVVALVDMAAS